MGERDDPQLGRRAQVTRAARLMELLGLNEDELCRILDLDPLRLLSGQLEHRSELPILLELLDERARYSFSPVSPATPSLQSRPLLLLSSLARYSFSPVSPGQIPVR